MSVDLAGYWSDFWWGTALSTLVHDNLTSVVQYASSTIH
uniref:Uncharacterized protein n=1 Tax=Anguilla anguilla TaxID=7936 RepID=A0A0E9XGC1_ANGAN